MDEEKETDEAGQAAGENATVAAPPVEADATEWGELDSGAVTSHSGIGIDRRFPI